MLAVAEVAKTFGWRLHHENEPANERHRERAGRADPSSVARPNAGNPLYNSFPLPAPRSRFQAPIPNTDLVESKELQRTRTIHGKPY